MATRSRLSRCASSAYKSRASLYGDRSGLLVRDRRSGERERCSGEQGLKESSGYKHVELEMLEMLTIQG